MFPCRQLRLMPEMKLEARNMCMWTLFDCDSVLNGPCLWYCGSKKWC